MAAAIHHGGGVGTYKSFSVVQRHAIPQLLNGRHVISTIRGLDSIRVIEAVLGIEIPPEAKLDFYDLETVKERQKIRRWWEWAPKGAYIIIDEAQLIYPKTTKISEYDYPQRDGLNSEETAEFDDRPSGFLAAFTMQRHYNWDLAIICPNIKMLVPEITQVSQVAYEHKRMGDLIPWRPDGWREHQHSPLQTAKASPHTPVQYNADKRIYQVYKSTKTGEHSKSGAELSIFKNKKLMFLLLLIISGVIVFAGLVFSRFSSPTQSQAVRQNAQVSVQDNISPTSNNADVLNNPSVPSVLGDELESSSIETTGFDSDKLSIVGYMFKEYIIEIGIGDNAYQLTTGDLYRAGVEIVIVSNCQINLKYHEKDYVVRCPLHNRLHRFKPKQKSMTVDVKPFSAITGA